MADDYKEYDLLPCPWCNSEVHVELDTRLGYLVTCGNYHCNCPTRVYWPGEIEARYRWNCGDTFLIIQNDWDPALHGGIKREVQDGLQRFIPS